MPPQQKNSAAGGTRTEKCPASESEEKTPPAPKEMMKAHSMAGMPTVAASLAEGQRQPKQPASHKQKAEG